MVEINKILICGTPISGNKGGAALVYGAIQSFRHYLPHAEFSLLSMNYESDMKNKDKYGIHIERARLWHLPLGFLCACLWSFFNKLNIKMNFLIRRNAVLRAYTKADLILNMTGIGFHDFFGKMVIVKHALWILPATILNIKIAAYSQSFGPFNSIFNRMLAKFCLNRVKVLVLRGQETEKYVRRLGISRPIHVCPDVGFLLEPIPTNKSMKILTNEKIADKPRPYIGIAVNNVIDRSLKPERNTYIKALGQIAEHMSARTKGTVIFIPHDVSDRGTAQKVRDELKGNTLNCLLDNDYSAEELKGLIGQCDYFIGSRYHSIVASLSMHIPTLVIGWSHKYREVMELWNQGNFIVDFRNMNLEGLKEKADLLLSSRDTIQNELKHLAPQIKEKVLTGASFVLANTR